MNRSHHTRSDHSRDRILHAAIREFSEHGLAGARTSAIAAAARVNKALLYYYFRDKEALYAAALEEVAGKVAGDALAVLDLDCSPGERVLRFALQHFDRIFSQHGFQALMQQEMVRFRTGQSNAMRIIAKKAFEPMWGRTLQPVEEGIHSGELCNVDPMQMMYAALGANVFFFLSAPMVRLVTSPIRSIPPPWPLAAPPPLNISAKPSLPTANAAHGWPKPFSPPCPSRRTPFRRERPHETTQSYFHHHGRTARVALCWYFFSTNHTSDLQLIGTVDANEVIVSSRIQGRIASLAVDEGQNVTAGQLVATIEADDLAAARNAAAATSPAKDISWLARAIRRNRRRATPPAR